MCTGCLQGRKEAFRTILSCESGFDCARSIIEDDWLVETDFLDDAMAMQTSVSLSATV